VILEVAYYLAGFAITKEVIWILSIAGKIKNYYLKNIHIN
jgi:hypothetical protein